MNMLIYCFKKVESTVQDSGLQLGNPHNSGADQVGLRADVFTSHPATAMASVPVQAPSSLFHLHHCNCELEDLPTFSLAPFIHNAFT